MANGFGSLYVGASGLQSSGNAINTVANNLANVDTHGYVRQQVLFADASYNSYGVTATTSQIYGLGVDIGDVIHARDIFLDKSFRIENGRQSFYASSYEIVNEVESYFQEIEGEAFSASVEEFWEAFQEFAKDPSDTVNQNLVIQRASLFTSRSDAVYTSLQQYQKNVNAKIREQVDRINEIGHEIYNLNVKIQRIEAGGIETAMDMRDTRDALLDELSGLANISYSEDPQGLVRVKLENVDFVDMCNVYEMSVKEDKYTGFIHPYWKQLSDIDTDDYRFVFSTDNVTADNKNDIGSIKALLIARGDRFATFNDMEACTSGEQYRSTLGASVLMNVESEIDVLVHTMATAINDMISPNVTYEGPTQNVYDKNGNQLFFDKEKTQPIVLMTGESKLCDTEHCAVGSDGKIPPAEMFVRDGCSRYVEAYDSSNNFIGYMYNEERADDISTCYSIQSIKMNEDLVQNETLLAHLTQNGGVDYDYAEKLAALWDKEIVNLNPADKTPCNFTGFYTKMTGELATRGSVFKTTSETLDNTVQSVDYQRQQVVGVSTDEELTNMIKYQSAYNASSRFINVVSQMIEYLLTSM